MNAITTDKLMTTIQLSTAFTLPVLIVIQTNHDNYRNMKLSVLRIGITLLRAAQLMLLLAHTHHLNEL